MNLYKYENRSDKLFIIGNESRDIYPLDGFDGVVIYSNMRNYSIGSYSKNWIKGNFSIMEESITIKNLKNTYKQWKNSWNPNNEGWLRVYKYNDEVIIRTGDGVFYLGGNGLEKISHHHESTKNEFNWKEINNITFKPKSITQKILDRTKSF